MIEVPELVEIVARQLVDEGYVYAEAVPIARWRRMSWPEERWFFDMVDGCIRILRAVNDRGK